MRTHFIIYRAAAVLGMISLVLSHHACEEEYQPPDFYVGPTHVVEGRLELAEGGTAQAIVLLNRDLPFWNAIGPKDLLRANIKSAQVLVKINNRDYPLRRICLNQLDVTLRRQLAAQLGIDVELLEEIDYCLYWHPTANIRAGDSASLEIRIEDTVLKAKTIMPRFQPLDTVYFVQRPFIDSFYELRIRLNDLEGPDYYRYFISVNGAAYRAFEHSVFNDWFFDGQSFELPLYNPFTSQYELTDTQNGATSTRSSFGFGRPWNTIATIKVPFHHILACIPISMRGWAIGVHSIARLTNSSQGKERKHAIFCVRGIKSCSIKNKATEMAGFSVAENKS